MRDYLHEGWEARSDKIPRAVKLNPKAFITGEDIYTPEELLTDPALEGFYLPRGIGAEFATLFDMPTGDLMVVSVQRRFGSPAQDARSLATAEALRPHLARAALISARLGLDRSRGAVESLAALGIPAGSLSARGRVIVGNELLAALTPGTVREVRGRLTFVDRDGDAALVRALEEMRAGSGVAAGCSIPIAAPHGGTPSVAHLLPVTGEGREVFVGAACLVLITRASPLSFPDGRLLVSLFGLTPAEARVARSTVTLGGVPAVAEALDLSRETVRSQLRAVLGKTGVSSQQGLTTLLASLAVGSPIRRGT
ncbi:helix-turn-helix transcriptional regulator [Lichenibacterium dinghuense]|uniref:helix-turn-helix transcriptional regulator n=1 Tax=Lichenibacterium dinghuense TaxID=2895977 RepID=UPI001F2A944C|nr:helix-turn-helix transcriptional regulator [Lichenibacterium sp. 6Y81]